MPTTRLVRRLGRRLSRSKRSSRSRSAASSNTEDAPLGSQKNPLHVLTRDTPIGWAVIQKAVDEFDKDQIEGVKNDIDTLLVFIGLFSAVLSAFLVVAVALLQEDVPTATLTTLRQMSAQNANYSIQGDFVHSTSPAPTSFTQFEPTANAIRINDLWTASLLISLITASFGILVKQWLREYMKFVTSFPQGRLRIRKFRRAGLETWKVLTIAACLPLLLQLALGIFFVGLCFYTAELHSSVRNTTLPLVAGWGFIFVFVTISPLFSAHCPYKTPALDSLVVAVRRSARMRWKVLLGDMSTRTMRRDWDSPLRGRMAQAIYDWTTEHFTRLEFSSEPYDEITAAKYEDGDLEIMVDADELQGNDEIVGTAMVDALQQMTPYPGEIIRFLLQILQHRVPWEGDLNSEPQVIDCSTATTRALDSILSILQQHLSIDFILNADPNFDDERVARWTVALHASVHTSHLGSYRVPSPLKTYIAAQPGLFAKVYTSRPSMEVLEDILDLACQYSRESQMALAPSFTRINSVVEPFFEKLGLRDSFEHDDDSAPWREVLNGISLRHAVVFLIDLLRDDIVQDRVWSDAQDNALSLTMKLIAVDPGEFRDSKAAVWHMFMLSKSDVAVANFFTLLIESRPLLFSMYVSGEDFSEDIGVLSHFTAGIETIAANSPDHLTRLSVLKACTTLTFSICRVEHAKRVALTEYWRGVFAALALLVQATPVLEDGDDREANEVYWCFSWLLPVDAPDSYDSLSDEEEYSAWRATFKAEESPVPDGFYVTLMQISIPTRPFWRVKRLQDMTAEDRETAAKDIEPYLRKPSSGSLKDHAAGLSTGRGEASSTRAGAAGRADTPVVSVEHENPRIDSEIVAEEPAPDANAAPVPPDGCGSEVDVDHGDEQDTAAIEETANRSSEAAGLLDTTPLENVLPEAEPIDVNPGVLEGEHGEGGLGEELAGMDLVDENIPDDTAHRSERAL